MKNDSLVVMVGGASSRMKKSLANTQLDTNVLEAAQKLHKSLIPLDKSGRPLLYYLFKNALDAGIWTIYLITSTENGGFKDFVRKVKEEKGFEGLKVKYAVQHIPTGRAKPMGTADALLQCLLQHQNLLNERFSVCNGDNLYSKEAFTVLKEKRTFTNALIAYDGEGLGHSEEKIAKFALLDFDKRDLLTDILEKPSKKDLKLYKSKHVKLWVSMNIFNFHGGMIYPFLQDCPIHPLRQEKELPEAVRRMVKENPEAVLCIPRSEKIPDLTAAEDIASFLKK